MQSQKTGPRFMAPLFSDSCLKVYSAGRLVCRKAVSKNILDYELRNRNTYE